ncbi:hypothetical protein IAQ61_003971 [Plenodomus lingam]|uniref:uncharacterized protein n=1 Tax=Leptosphaeria maculans TaxID=5022 RepID=UPI00331D6D81|nr:hypothetical protein IAQ61_003971 [Plenodomus lingam]
MQYADPDTPEHWPTVKPIVNGVIGAYATSLFLDWLRCGKDGERRDIQHAELLRAITKAGAARPRPVRLAFSAIVGAEISPIPVGSDRETVRLEEVIKGLRSRYEGDIELLNKERVEIGVRLRAAEEAYKMEREEEEVAAADALARLKTACEAELKRQSESVEVRLVEVEESYQMKREQEEAAAAAELARLKTAHEAELKHQSEALKAQAHKESATSVASVREQVLKECEVRFNAKLAATTKALEEQHEISLDNAQQDAESARAANTAHQETITQTENALKRAESTCLSLQQQLATANTELSSSSAALNLKLAAATAESKKSAAALQTAQVALQTSAERETQLTACLDSSEIRTQDAVQEARMAKELMNKVSAALKHKGDKLDAATKMQAAQEKEIAELKALLRDITISTPEAAIPASTPLTNAGSTVVPEKQKDAEDAGIASSVSVGVQGAPSVLETTAPLPAKTADSAPITTSPLPSGETGALDAQNTPVQKKKKVDWGDSDDEGWSPIAAFEEFKDRIEGAKGVTTPFVPPRDVESNGLLEGDGTVVRDTPRRPSAAEKKKFELLMGPYHFTPETGFVSPETLEFARKVGVDVDGLGSGGVASMTALVPRRSKKAKEKYEEIMAGFGWDAGEASSKTEDTQHPELESANSPPKTKKLDDTSNAPAVLPLSEFSTKPAASTAEPKSTPKTAAPKSTTSTPAPKSTASSPAPKPTPSSPAPKPTPSSPAPKPTQPPSNPNEWNPPPKPTSIQHHKICHNCSTPFYHPSATHDPQNHLRHRGIFRKHIAHCKTQFRTCENQGCGKVMSNDWFYGTHQKECRKATLAKGLKLHDPKALREKQAAREAENRKREEARRGEKRVVGESAGEVLGLATGAATGLPGGFGAAHPGARVFEFTGVGEKNLRSSKYAVEFGKGLTTSGSTTPAPSTPAPTTPAPSTPTPPTPTPSTSTPTPSTSTPTPSTSTPTPTPTTRPKPRTISPSSLRQEPGIHSIDANVNPDATVTCICEHCKQTINLPFSKTDRGWLVWDWTAHKKVCGGGVQKTTPKGERPTGVDKKGKWGRGRK